MSRDKVNRKIIKKYVKNIAESVQSNTPSKPAPTKPAPTTVPGKPGTDRPKPRRPFGNPDVKPAPKNENDKTLDRIVARFKSKKMNEGDFNPTRFDDFSKRLGFDPKGFTDPTELLKSASSRLITAIQLEQWNLVEEVAADIHNFVKRQSNS